MSWSRYGNKDFKQFANHGWPHYEAMALLMPSNSKGTYAHRGTWPTVRDSGASSSTYARRGTQPTVQDSRASTSSMSFRPSPNITPFTIPPYSTPFSPPFAHDFDVSSMSSLDISPSEASVLAAGVEDLTGAFRDLNDILRIMVTNATHTSAPPPPPSYAPTSISHGATAAGQFLDHIRASKERRDEWLSDDQIIQMLSIFSAVEGTGELYMQIAEHGNETLLRGWVRQELARKRG
ncbi:hypothetical protein BC827DRAFT_266553 [Russula dissimulans]|nr:hypothetical protein BC827DRAFT_266553 [Russula dissimulans]